MKKFPHIEQFRSVIKTVQLRHDYVTTIEGTAVYTHKTPYPIIHFIGNPKLHGTNTGVRNVGGKLVCQLREFEIDIHNDSYGFVNFINGLDGDVKDIVFQPNSLWIGEWCGKGIQKGCAIHQLSKRFIIFDHYTISNDEYTRDANKLSRIFSIDNLRKLNENNIFFIDQFKQFQIKIDFNDTSHASMELERLTKEVEAKCPVGDYFNVDGIGEGIVWKSLMDPTDSKLWFKTKGEKHKNTKTKKLVEIDPIKAKSIKDFVEFSVTEQRLEQALSELNLKVDENPDKRIGEFLKWISKDIARECADDLKASELVIRDVSKAINNKALPWFRKKA